MLSFLRIHSAVQRRAQLVEMVLSAWRHHWRLQQPRDRKRGSTAVLGKAEKARLFWSDDDSRGLDSPEAINYCSRASLSLPLRFIALPESRWKKARAEEGQRAAIGGYRGSRLSPGADSWYYVVHGERPMHTEALLLTQTRGLELVERNGARLRVFSSARVFFLACASGSRSRTPRSIEPMTRRRRRRRAWQKKLSPPRSYRLSASSLCFFSPPENVDIRCYV